ncbi:hypothetical protein DFH09DRAFT_1127327 [Mycena vulgaris]|nr:hypothetical protein DFH09DRAFT_1127327 [Mycena vulgaris]
MFTNLKTSHICSTLKILARVQSRYVYHLTSFSVGFNTESTMLFLPYPANSASSSSSPSPSPSTILATKLAGEGSRGESVRRLLASLNQSMSQATSSPTGRAHTVPIIAQNLIRSASVSELSVLASRGSGLFYSMTAQLIRHTIPHPIGDQFSITSVRSFLRSSHGVEVLLRRLWVEIPTGSPIMHLFCAVLGVLRGVSRAVCKTWLRVVLRNVLSALKVEGSSILTDAVPSRSRPTSGRASDATARFMARLKAIVVDLKVGRLPRPIPTSRPRKALPGRRTLLERINLPPIR